MRDLRRFPLSYVVAIVATAAAVYIRWLLNPILDHRLPFITLYAATAVSVWLGGWRPAVLSTVLGLVAADLVFVETESGSPLSIHAAGGPVGMIIYLASSLIVVGLGDGMRRARTRAEEAARDALARRKELQLITSETPVLLTRCSKDRRFVFVNRACAEFFGRRPEDIVGRPVAEVMGEQAAATISPYVDRVLRGERVAFETEIAYAHPGPCFMHATYAPEYDDHGEIVGWVASVRDVTERKQAELALRESEERFRNMADAAPVLIWVSGTDKLCTWFNKPWLDFVGRPMEREIGNGWADNVHADDLSRCLEIYVEAFEARCPFSMEYRLKRHDGEYRWILDNGTPRHGSEGEFVGYIGSCVDITELKRTEDALRDADRRKDEFLAILAHELRNPLAPVRNAVEILRQKGPEIPELMQARDIIDRQLLQVTRLIDDLMDVARITRDRLELRKERLDLAVVVRFAVEACRERIDQSGQQLVLELPSEPQYVDGDLTRLVQVVSNLLSNATKFSHPGGRIKLIAQRRGPEIVVTVRDEGIGIAAEMMPRIFEAFVQADRSLERAQGGLGIGLTLVKRVLEMHGGTIEAQSEGAGKGSTFTVRLPVSVLKPELAASPDDQVPPKAVRAGDRVLIADDNKDAADSLRVILDMLGYETRAVHDGAEALKAAEEFRPAFALLDLGMPRTSGYDVARHIRRQPWGKDMVLLAVTGWGQEEDRNKTREAGFDDHFVKPVDPMVLAERLASAVQKADHDRS